MAETIRLERHHPAHAAGSSNLDANGTDGAPISRLRVPERDALDAETRLLVNGAGNENWVRALALNGPTARRFVGYFADLFDPAKGLLPLAERELIAVVVSVENGCGYCEVHHTHGLAGALNGDDVRARRIALDYHLVEFSEREQALVDLAVAVTRDPKSLDALDFAHLRALGLDDAEILEAVEISAWFNHTNRLTISLGIVPDAKFFKSEPAHGGRHG